MGRYVSSPLGQRGTGASRRRIPTARALTDDTGRGRRSHRIPACRRAAAAGRSAARRSGSISAASPTCGRRAQAAHRRRQSRPKEIFDLFALLDRAADAQIDPQRGRRALPAAWARARRAIGEFRAAAAATRRQDPARRQRRRPRQRRAGPRCAAISSGRRSPSRIRSSGSCARTAKKACCRRSSSPSATSASWCR